METRSLGSPGQSAAVIPENPAAWQPMQAFDLESTTVDSKLTDESARLAALQRYDILDTPRERAFDRITSLVKAVLQVPIAVVSLIDRDRQWFKSCVGLEAESGARDTSFCTHTIQARQPLLIPDARLDRRFAENPHVTGPPHIVSYAGIPLCSPDGYNLGSLCAIDTLPRHFDASQIAVLESFAALIMEEMELRRIAQVDHLTGATTRRGFMLETERAISHFVRQKRPSVLMLFDMDHFKIINDTHGHAAGDNVLRTVSNTLSMLLRSTDTIGRLGGEEFGILLTDIDQHRAREIAERLRQAVEAVSIPHDPPLHATASFGIAALGTHCLSFDSWVARADEALYRAKHSGRNRIAAAGEPTDAITALPS